MEPVFAVLTGLFFAVAVYLMLSKFIIRVLLGVAILGNAVNLLIFINGRLLREVPPVLAAGRYADVPPARADDWSGLAIPAVPVAPAAASADGLEHLGSTDDGGPRRQPELSETVAYDPDLVAPAADLGLLDDDDMPLPLSVSLPRQLDPALQRPHPVGSDSRSKDLRRRR